MSDKVVSMPSEERFQARIDAEEKIEPKDWMPEKYRQHDEAHIDVTITNLSGFLKDLAEPG